MRDLVLSVMVGTSILISSMFANAYARSRARERELERVNETLRGIAAKCLRAECPQCGAPLVKLSDAMPPRDA